MIQTLQGVCNPAGFVFADYKFQLRKSFHHATANDVDHGVNSCRVSEGVTLKVPPRGPPMFGEAPSRVVVSVTETGEDAFLDVLKDSKTPFMLLGHVTKGRIAVDDKNFGKIDEYKTIYNNSLAKKLNK